MQTRVMSLLEALANIIVGYALAVLTQLLVFPLFGLSVAITDSLLMGLVFTVVSLARAFALRRIFDRFSTTGGR